MKSMGVFATVAVALLSGFVSGYALAHHQLTRNFEDKVDTEVEEMRQYMSAKYGVKNKYEGSDEEVEDSVDPKNLIEAELADLKKKRNEPKIGDRELKDDTPYYRYHSDGTPDESVEGEDEDPTKLTNKTLSSDDYEVVNVDDFLNHEYDTTLHFTYYYNEELLVDFWRNQIHDEDRHQYIGDIEFERPDEYDDESSLYILNHVEKLAVHVNVSVLPVPDETYRRHETYIKNQFAERNDN